jgi:hypothetical protein
LRAYFHSLIARYLALLVRPDDTLVDLDPLSTDLAQHFPQARVVGSEEAAADGPLQLAGADYVVLNGRLQYVRDIQTYLERVRDAMRPDARLIIVYYSMLWRPMISLATTLGLRRKTPEVNWLSNDDVVNLLDLADFQVIRRDPKVLLPAWIPLISTIFNRYIAPLPVFSLFCIANIVVARKMVIEPAARPSVSVIVPARNEAGNIEQIVARVPAMGPNDELIFIEGGSRDDTWARIEDVQRRLAGTRTIISGKQTGKGKGDAVRLGFHMATCEILMILDADLTVPPEDLPKFYAAIVSGKGEFINGSRLVYPMERNAMRFANLLGNKFFAAAFSFVLGQRFKDTLCGTKVLTRANYLRLARNRDYFGDFDPFGDFDLIFGAARMGLRIVEVPIGYRERTYGETNISRWRHGAILLAMLAFASRRLRFI